MCTGRTSWTWKHQPGYANKYLERMHWQFGRQVIRVAEPAARTENLYPVFLTCFRCSPDSFLLSYVKDILSHYGKPFLILQLDAHASDVGYATRIEAALQSFRTHRGRDRGRGCGRHRRQGRCGVTHARDDQLRDGDTVLITAMDDLISRFWADSFERAGHPAVLLETTAAALNTGYRYASGGECMPLAAIVGAAIERVRAQRPGPGKTFFFMPTIPMACNMPQFPVFADMAFRAAGMGGVRIGRINFMALGDSLPPVACHQAAGVLHRGLHPVQAAVPHQALRNAAGETPTGLLPLPGTSSAEASGKGRSCAVLWHVPPSSSAPFPAMSRGEESRGSRSWGTCM